MTRTLKEPHIQLILYRVSVNIYDTSFGFCWALLGMHEIKFKTDVILLTRNNLQVVQVPGLRCFGDGSPKGKLPGLSIVASGILMLGKSNGPKTIKLSLQFSWVQGEHFGQARDTVGLPFCGAAARVWAQVKHSESHDCIKIWKFSRDGRPDQVYGTPHRSQSLALGHICPKGTE